MQEQMPYVAVGCALALLTALGVVGMRKPVYCAFALLLHSLSLAGLYLLLSAEFVAIGQVIIYSGAIVVLFLFVVLLLPQGGRDDKGGLLRDLGAALAAAAVLVGLLQAMPGDPPPIPESPDTVEAIGRSLFGSMLVPFELSAIPLLLAIVAGVTLWRRQEKEEHG
jgi:NADH-quinone oxidoreductase subunit J